MEKDYSHRRCRSDGNHDRTRLPTGSTGSRRFVPEMALHVQPVPREGATSRCCSTPGRGRCSRSCPRRWRASSRSSSCAGSRSVTSKSDECGSMNDWLAAAPDATVAHTAVGCMVSGERPRRPPAAPARARRGHRPRRQARAAPRHAARAARRGTRRLYFEETTGTLLCGDLFTAVGAEPGAHDRRHRRARDRRRRHVPRHVASRRRPRPTIRSLADLEPRTHRAHARPVVQRRHGARRSARSPTPTRRGTLPRWALPCERGGMADPLDELQILLRAGVDRCRAAQVPYVVAVTGSVAVGKSATAQVLRESLSTGSRRCARRGRLVRRLPVPQPGARRARSHACARASRRATTATRCWRSWPR